MKLWNLFKRKPKIIYRVPTHTRKAVDCSMKNDIHQQLAAELKADRLKAECGKA